MDYQKFRNIFVNNMKYVFLDTNVLLHCNFINEIDWLEVSATDSCVLMLSPIIIDELDKYKFGSSRINKRAKQILLYIENCFDKNQFEILPHTTLEILSKKPKQDIYEKFDLNFEEQDHRLFASILGYKMQNPNKRIYICSLDIGPRLRAKQYNIEVIKIPDNFILPPENNEQEKKIKTLQQENTILKARIPNLKILFENNQHFLEKEIEIIKTDKSPNIEDKMVLLRQEYPYLKQKEELNENPLSSLLASKFSIFSLTESQINNYNEQLDIFFRDYEEYLYYKNGFLYSQNLSFELKLFLSNTGSTPAEDIDIHLHFPDGFELKKFNDYSKIPILPKPPYKPTSAFDIRPYLITDYRPDFSSFASKYDVHGPKIIKTNSYDVTFYRKELKHFYNCALDELVVIYKSQDEMNSFSINYEIIAANLPNKSTGDLSVIIKKR